MSQRINRCDSFSSGDGKSKPKIKNYRKDEKKKYVRNMFLNENKGKKVKGTPRKKFAMRLGNMKLGDDPNPTNISNLTAFNLDGMSFDS